MARFRVPHWWGLAISAGLLLAAGGVGVQMNDAALRTAERVHRTDAAALGANNANLTAQCWLLSAKELDTFGRTAPLQMRKGSAADRAALNGLVRISSFHQYAAVLTDLTGTPLNSSDIGNPRLPAVDAPGYASLRRDLLAGRPGFSSLLTVGDKKLLAVAVPVRDAAGTPIGLVIGYADAMNGQVQHYVEKLGSGPRAIILIDPADVVAASSKPALIGERGERAVIEAAHRAVPGKPLTIEYTSRHGEPMIASVVKNDLGWTNVHTQSVDSFYGPVRSSSTRTNLAMLALILVAIACLAALTHRAQLTRRRSDERFTALVQNSTDVITVLDRDGAVLWDSPSAERILGFATGDRYGMQASMTLHPDDRDHARVVFAELLASAPGTLLRLQARVVHADGAYSWCDLSVSNLLHNPAIRGVVVNARDISHSRELQEQLQYQADHDPLTGLPNRALGYQRLSARLADKRAGAVAVLFIDLDGFKAVNDNLGHDIGDELLRRVAGRISAVVRGEDTLARVGGDEFIVLLEGRADRAEVDVVAARIVESVREPLDISGHRVRVGASVGLSMGLAGGSADDVLRAADSAMYHAKRAGGGRVHRTLDDRLAAEWGS